MTFPVTTYLILRTSYKDWTMSLKKLSGNTQTLNINEDMYKLKLELHRMVYITSDFIIQILISNRIITTLSISNLTPMG
jgi:hypothetical protein